jgi:Pup amidohydrolase
VLEAGGDPGIVLANPVAAMHQVSRDVSMTARLELVGRPAMTALQVQWSYLAAARQLGADVLGERTGEMLDLWAEVLELLETEPRKLADRLDWLAKLAILDGYRARDGLDWSASRLAAVDLQYADTRPERGLALRLEQRGSLCRLTTDAQVEQAIAVPPPDTRAWFRGECVRRFGAHVAAASWDSVILDVPGRTSLVRIPTQDPLRGTRAHVAGLLDSVGSVTELVGALSRGGSR